MQKNKNRNNKEIQSVSYSNDKDLVKIEILGVDVTNDTKENILEYIINSLQKKEKPYYIVTPNPEMIVLSTKNNEFKHALNNAKIALNDGVGLSFAARILNKPLKERFTGVEIVEKLCEKCNDWPITIGFLGAGDFVAEKAADCLRIRYPRLKVVFAEQEWPQDLVNKKEVVRSKYYGVSDKLEKGNIPTTNYKLHATDVIDVLFVAFGAPKQELWMAEHVGKIPVKVMIGVGGAFDQIVNPSLRPPHLVQNIGLGWLYRLVRQPWRFKRQLALVEFVQMVVKQKFYNVISKEQSD